VLLLPLLPPLPRQCQEDAAAAARGEANANTNTVIVANTSHPGPRAPVAPVRAVCLGWWLNTEGWILPPIFDDIPNKDLLVRERAGGFN
jgi:hypothetical protein